MPRPDDAGLSAIPASRVSPARRQTGSTATDLLSAITIGMLALAAMAMSLGFEAPGSTLTAPGMLPFLTGLTLLVMSASLGHRAIRDGALQRLRAGAGRLSLAALRTGENGRTLLLIGIIVAYVVSLGTVGIELELPLPGGAAFPISSYEILSVATITLILKLFWRGPLLRCTLISLLSVEAVAAVFRYGFTIPMPAAF